MKSIDINILTIILLLSFSASAQQVTISTDRPDQTDGVATVPMKMVQIENGLYFSDATIVNNFMLRYGITNTTELRLLCDIGKEGRTNGLHPITFSIKQKLLMPGKYTPSVTFIGNITAGPLAGKDFNSSNWPLSFLLSFENELSEQLSLGYNIGTTNDFDNLFLTLNIGADITEKISLFGEYFGTANNHLDQNIDFGILYLINSRLQLDAAIGRQLTSDGSFFGTAGVSFLF